MVNYDIWGLRFIILGAVGLVMNTYFLKRCCATPIVVGLFYSSAAVFLGFWFLIVPRLL